MTLDRLNVFPEPKRRPDHCDTHGAFESRCYLGSIWSKCPTCSTLHAERERVVEQQALEQRRLDAWQQLIGQSGIPERFQDRTLDNFNAATDGQRRALELARAYVANFDQVLATGRSLLFVGRPGTGKTHLAAGIAMAVMRAQRRTVLFLTVMRAMRRIKDSYRGDSHESERDSIDTIVAPDLLILDEVGVQFGSQFERNMLFDILNERYERRRPTILMSNLPIPELTEYLGERIIDRIREDGGRRVVFDWPSHRTATLNQPGTQP